MRDSEGSDGGLIEEVSGNLSRGTEKKPQNPQFEQPGTRQMFEQTTPEYKSRAVPLRHLLRSVHLLTMLIRIPPIYGVVGVAVTRK